MPLNASKVAGKLGVRGRKKREREERGQIGYCYTAIKSAGRPSLLQTGIKVGGEERYKGDYPLSKQHGIVQ